MAAWRGQGEPGRARRPADEARGAGPAGGTRQHRAVRAARQPSRPPEPREAARPSRTWGTRPGRLGPVAVVSGAAAGLILTIVAGTEPGPLLGAAVIFGTVIGGLAVRQASAYLIIPVPAPACFVAAAAAGLIHDRSIDTSRTMIAANGAQWVADAFPWMVAATVVAIAMTILRWLMTGRVAYRLAELRGSRKSAESFWTEQAYAAVERATTTKTATSQHRQEKSADTRPPRQGRRPAEAPGESPPDWLPYSRD